MSRTPKNFKKSLPLQSNQTNLFSFFQRTPKAEGDEEKEKGTPIRSEHQERDDEVEDITPKKAHENPSTPKSTKRQRMILSSDDEDENEVTAKKPKPSESNPSTPKQIQTPSRSTKPMELKTPTRTPGRTPSKAKPAALEPDLEVDFVHLSFNFLKPANIKDINKNKPDNPNYDPRTLYVPEDFMKDQSPGHRQWWHLKAHNFDTILFFKVGKFYELYHMDAVTAVENLGIVYMKGKYAHCGFPEMGYAKFAEMLINKGFKVARVEQTETPDQLAERAKREKVKDKVVRRELCRITSTATRTFGVLEENDYEKNVHSDNSYLLSIVEKKILNEEGHSFTRFGVCMIDCAVGEFLLCDFIDDASMSSLRTLLAHNQPSEYIFERGHLSQNTLAILSSVLGQVPSHGLTAKKEFWTGEETLKKLMDDHYLGANVNEWPEIIKNMVLDLDEAIPRPDPAFDLALSALGGTVSYLKRCLIDVDLITIKKFSIYEPTPLKFGEKIKEKSWNNVRMVLDSYSVNSLHLLPPSDPLRKLSRKEKEQEGGNVFSVYNTINHCSTPFGKRELRRWICAPSCDPKVLTRRQQAVQFLTSDSGADLVREAANHLKKLPDLERLFQSIHVIGLKYRFTEHPDSRAQMFEPKKYGARKVKNLCLALDGMEDLFKLLNYFNKIKGDFEEIPFLVNECLGKDEETMLEDLKHFKNLIGQREKAVSEGRIIPRPGMDKEYDDSLNEIEAANENLNELLKKEQKKHRCNQIKFNGAVKTPYFLEIPDEVAKNLDYSYELKSKKQGWKRFVTEELQELIGELEEAQKKTADLNDDFTRRVFASFDERKERWAHITTKIANFDCILSLSLYALQSGIEMTMPEFDFETDKPFVQINYGYHPCLATGSFTTSNDYIPNDTSLGGDKAALLLLTGANMGGKSTLMRQVAVLCILAQLGGKVPAKAMKLSPVDRVFCRIGASDCLAAGQSTFYMELNETNIILKSATSHSLAIIDELGRGTSTHDGTAIAGAVLKYMAEHVGCRTIFSTHYHSLCTLAADNPRIVQGHMACLVEKDDNIDDPCMDNITFLYQLVFGHSSKSYGFFTAKMAGIKPELIRRANRASSMVFKEEAALKKLNDLKLSVQNGISDDDLQEQIGISY